MTPPRSSAKKGRGGDPSAPDGMTALTADLARPQGERWPCYLLAGDDVATMEEAVALLRKDLDPDASATKVHSGFEHSLERVVDACRQRDMWTPRQVVLARHAEAYLKPRGGQQEDKDYGDAKSGDPMELLLKYLTRPDRATTLILVHEGNPDRKRKLFKAFDEQGRVFLFELPATDAQAVAWVRKRFTAEGLSASEEVLRTLVDDCGSDTMLLRQNVEKLILYLGPDQRQVSMDALEAVVINTRMDSIYALQDCLATGDLAESLTLMRNILRQKEFDPVRMVFWLHLRIRQLYRLQMGGGNAEAAGLRGWQADKLLPVAGRHPASVWGRALRILYDTDRRIKSSPLPAEAVTEEAIVRICTLLRR